MRYSSISGGAGTMAEKVVAGSVPMATATSMRSPRMAVRVWVVSDCSEAAGAVPPAVRAMRSTAAALSRGGGAEAVAKLLGGVLLALPVHAGGVAIVDLHAVHADVALAAPGVFGDDAGKGDERASVLRPGGEDGEPCGGRCRSPLRMTSLQGASERSTTLGKKLPTSARVGKSFSLSSRLTGVGGWSRVRMRSAISSSESASRASFMRRSEPNWFIKTRAPG